MGPQIYRSANVCVQRYAQQHSLHYHLGSTLPRRSHDCDPVCRVQYEKRENSSQEDFPVNVLLWVRAINPPLAALRPETRITSSQNRPVFGFHRRTRLGASDETLTVSVCVSVCVREKRENLWYSVQESEPQVNSKPLVSNLLIFLEVKKTSTSLLS